MNGKIKRYRIIAYPAALLWVVLGLLTIGSIAHGVSGLPINLVMSILFGAIGYYLYAKTKSVIKLMASLAHLKDSDRPEEDTVSRFLFFEHIFAVISALLGLMCLSAAIARVFGERLPVFG